MAIVSLEGLCLAVAVGAVGWSIVQFLRQRRETERLQEIERILIEKPHSR